jgi:hypothetical protein
LEDRIRTVAAQVHALEAELVGLLAEHAGACGWLEVGSRSHAQWVSLHTKFTMGDARRLVGLSARVGEVPSLMAAARAGEISVGMVAVGARVATAGNEAQVTEILRTCTPAQAGRVLGAYRSVTRQRQSEPAEADWFWRDWIDDAGRHRITAALDPLTGAALVEARRAVTARLHAEDPHEPVTIDETVSTLANHILDAARADRLCDEAGEPFAVVVSCDLPTLAHALGLPFDPDRPVRLGAQVFLPRTGARLTDTQLARAVCEGSIQLLIETNGIPLWIGHQHRTFTRTQRRALRHRDGGCAWPGCDRTRHLHAHHICHHADGGPTDIDNGVLLCGTHHRQTHRDHITITPNGTTFTFTDPHGRPIHAPPRPPRPPHHPHPPQPTTRHRPHHLHQPRRPRPPHPLGHPHLPPPPPQLRGGASGGPV